MRYIEIGEWIYEIKLVKAIKTPMFGQPYTAICHFNFVGDEVTLESMLSKDEITKVDMQTHVKFLQEMSVSAFNFSRYKNGIERKGTIKL